MNTFFKTFTICLIITLGFLFYKFFGEDGYSKNVNRVNKSVYSLSKEEKFIPKEEKEPTEEKPQQETPIKEPQEKPQPNNLHTCFFYTSNGKLTPVTREFKGNNNLESAILILLKGPLISESKQGIYTEIPPNVNLISTTVTGDSVIVNLSSNFANGGGITSVENRVKQLSTTVKHIVKHKQVYLYIEGKQVEYLSGDGVYIKQPLD